MFIKVEPQAVVALLPEGVWLNQTVDSLRKHFFLILNHKDS